MSAPSIIPHKRVFLGNIENIPSSVLRQTTPIKNKKEASIPIVSPVISNSDILLSTEESKPSPQAKPSHSLASGSTTPRYCYTREFILMFKDLPHCTVPPNPSPLEILKKYNEEHEFNLLREKLIEAQSHNQRSSAHHPQQQQQQNNHRAHNSAPSSSNSSPANNVTSLTDNKVALPAVSTANTDRVIPLRMNKHSKEISTKPMFSPARRQSSTPTLPPTSFTVVDNKENFPFVSKEKRSVVVGLGVKSPRGTPTSSVVSLKNGTIPSPRFAVKPKPDIYDPLEQTVAQHLIPTTPPASSVSLFNTPITPYPGPTPNNTPVRGLLPSPSSTTTSVVSPSILALLPVSMLPPNTPLCAVLVPPSSSSSPMATLSSPTFTQLYTALPASPSPYIVALSPSTPNTKINNVNIHNGMSPSTPTTAAVTTGEALDVITARMKGVLRETDPKRLVNRQKQIDYGKATVGYTRYCELIPKSKRKREDPKTPNRHQICSKRSWDGQIRKWRRLLHLFDPESSNLDTELDCEDLEGEDDDDDVDSNSDEQNTSTITTHDVDAVEVNTIDTSAAV